MAVKKNFKVRKEAVKVKLVRKETEFTAMKVRPPKEGIIRKIKKNRNRILRKEFKKDALCELALTYDKFQALKLAIKGLQHLEHVVDEEDIQGIEIIAHEIDTILKQNIYEGSEQCFYCGLTPEEETKNVQEG